MNKSNDKDTFLRTMKQIYLQIIFTKSRNQIFNKIWKSLKKKNWDTWKGRFSQPKKSITQIVRWKNSLVWLNIKYTKIQVMNKNKTSKAKRNWLNKISFELLIILCTKHVTKTQYAQGKSWKEEEWNKSPINQLFLRLKS